MLIPALDELCVFRELIDIYNELFISAIHQYNNWLDFLLNLNLITMYMANNCFHASLKVVYDIIHNDTHNLKSKDAYWKVWNFLLSKSNAIQNISFQTHLILDWKD